MKRSIFVSLMIAVAAFADPRSQFEEGLQNYRNSDWENAARIWEDLSSSGYHSGALYYNLGNAYFRLGDVGRALVNYERAKRLLPRDGDVEHNIEIAQLAVVDRVESPIRLTVWKWVDSIRDSLTLSELGGSFQFVGLLLAAMIGFLFFGPPKYRYLTRRIVTMASVCLILFGSWYGWRSALDSRVRAVVVSDEADIYSGPDDTSTQLFTLHEGTIVSSKESLSEWIRIQLSDGREGWIRADEIEVI